MLATMSGWLLFFRVLQRFKDDILVDADQVGCRHVREQVHQVDEGGEVGVGCQEG
jgi:hypothetical protein